MGESSNAAALRQLLVGQYDELKRRLARRLGSEDLAGDVLQETYLHLERPGPSGTVKSPKQYLLTIATNIARMGFRRERRSADLAELDAALGFADEAPDPLRNVEAREELAALQRAFAELTPRRRRILFASRVEGIRLRDLAAEFGLSQRAVEKELRAALMLCGLRLDREIVQRFGPKSQQASMESGDAENAGVPRDD
ncbi:ECF sigma factor VreI [Aliidongia dinghuensis]|uniref:ECF sigma factor VreI n=1 Tax=Aliidongia dinghuensis TaxID=1867774 RepID=A0A8J3E7J9_9PROT|nr:sigma-70 family RNA polymerase sigma factor [Aliidongia dinghuensis]GGF42958.1 ECF sigma factor VreI [Aliidongia dinghuensis]